MKKFIYRVDTVYMQDFCSWLTSPLISSSSRSSLCSSINLHYTTTYTSLLLLLIIRFSKSLFSLSRCQHLYQQLLFRNHPTKTRQSSAPSTSSVTSPTHRPPSESISLHCEKTEGHKPERAQASQAERLSQGRGRCHASRGSPAPDDVLTRSYVVRAPRPTSR